MRKLKDDPLHDSADVQFYIFHHENKIFNSFKFSIYLEMQPWYKENVACASFKTDGFSDVHDYVVSLKSDYKSIIHISNL